MSVNRDLGDDPDLQFLREEAYPAGVDPVHRWGDRAWYVRGDGFLLEADRAGFFARASSRE